MNGQRPRRNNEYVFLNIGDLRRKYDLSRIELKDALNMHLGPGFKVSLDDIRSMENGDQVPQVRMENRVLALQKVFKGEKVKVSRLGGRREFLLFRKSKFVFSLVIIAVLLIFLGIAVVYLNLDSLIGYLSIIGGLVAMWQLFVYLRAQSR